MWQRAEVVQREALLEQLRSKVAVPDCAVDRDGRRSLIDLDARREIGNRNEIGVAVSDAVERMASAKDSQILAGGNDVLQLFDRRRFVQLPGAEGDVAGPVAQAY